MTGTLAGLGLFFILVGCACIKGYEDLKKNDVKGSVASADASGSALLSAGDKETGN